jgi:hypothetical protein
MAGRRETLLFIAGLLFVTQLQAQSHPDLTGSWKQNNDRCVPRQHGEATITITIHDPKLTVEIDSVYGQAPRSHAVKDYNTDGKPAVMKDSEGDEIDTTVAWRDQSLVFSTDEHEDGKIKHSEEVWTLIDNGTALERVRKGFRAGQTQTLIYVRVGAGHADNPSPPRGPISGN